MVYISIYIYILWGLFLLFLDYIEYAIEMDYMDCIEHA